MAKNRLLVVLQGIAQRQNLTVDQIAKNSHLKSDDVYQVLTGQFWPDWESVYAVARGMGQNQQQIQALFELHQETLKENLRDTTIEQVVIRPDVPPLDPQSERLHPLPRSLFHLDRIPPKNTPSQPQKKRGERKKGVRYHFTSLFKDL